MPPKVAAVTMVYDEPAMLPIWARHYARQVGADYCYVVDHGSRDALVLPPGVNTLRLPRSPHDELRRAGFISDLVASLLDYYDWVLYTDCDELLLADPRRFANLPAFCAAAAADTITAIGLDVQHVPAEEAALDTSQPIGPQRKWVRFSSALCKPVLTRRKLVWNPGFHTADAPLLFDHLYMFHLHWADQDVGLARLDKTRTMAFAEQPFSAHLRIAEAEWRCLFDGMASFPRLGHVELDPAKPPLLDWLEQTRQSAAAPGGPALGINGPVLWPIPPRFRDRI